MKHIRTYFIAVQLLSTVLLHSQQSEIFCADPTVFVENGKYYLTGTTEATVKGFPIYTSTDLHHWTPSLHNALTKDDHTFGKEGFWAPQIYRIGADYFMSYTADEQTAVARSSAIEGPYRQPEIGPIDRSAKNIDSFVFCDDDGSYYLYHVRFDRGNYIWAARFDPQSEKIDPSTLRQCLTPTQPWENTGAYPSDPIMEGPTVFKRNGTYYLIYSANHFMSIDYAVGYATAPSPFGPWTKAENNPIIHRSIVGEKGSGHGDLFFDLNGTPRYVYHTHYSDNRVSPRRTRIITLRFNDSPSAGPDIISVLPHTKIVPTYTK